jgi:hypothetical protein
MAGLAGHAAAAGVHRRDQLEARRIGDAVLARAITVSPARAAGAGCRAPAAELGQFVEEQHAVVGERRLARPGAQPPPTSAAIEAE